MKRGRIILFALCIMLLCISSWQALPHGITQSEPQWEPQISSEKPILQSVQRAKDEGKPFPVVDLFEQQLPSLSRIATANLAEAERLQQDVYDGTILTLNRSQARNIFKLDPEALTLTLPTAMAGTVELELVKADVHSPDFTVGTSSSEGPVKYEAGLHYQGVVKGDPNSLAAISIFKNEVMGFYSTDEGGNVVLGKLKGKNPKNRHILYAERDLKKKQEFVCDTKDDGEILPLSSIELQAVPVANKRVKIYVEVDFDLYQNKGSNVVNVTNFITALFNQSAVLYSNEGIPIVLSQVFVWTTSSPYNGTSSSAVLTQFQAFRNSFNGDFAHLVSLGPNLGGIAPIDTFCNTNPDNRQCFSDIESGFNNVPTYSWSVYVFTHEMGHLMGSRHTHACVWNGNGTAIDGCGPSAGFTEGSCSPGPTPSGGGTIMSYCHLTNVGINFSNGFGPQPGNVIRNRFTNAGCLAAGVPLYRFWNPSVTDHYYTINLNDVAPGWELEKIQCIVFRQQVSGTVPLYRYWNPSVWGDHFYTINFSELGNGAQGWSLERIECYIYSQQQSGTIPLYRYWNSSIGDHFYTTTLHELGNGSPGYVFEKIEGYVLPNN